MIKRLKRRMLLLVISVLVLVSGGIVFAINYMNWRSISADAQETLEILSLNSGKRPQMHRDEEHDGRLSPGQPPDMENVLATLSNFYVVSLTSDDEITGWTSVRADLYSDEQVQALTDAIDRYNLTHFGGTKEELDQSRLPLMIMF